ncbi:MAG: DEAD/DEAH box helicase [Lentisphaeria bacterium]|nr:DEAD/DEAH box helicase [Lentisphaeria bacterium]
MGIFSELGVGVALEQALAKQEINAPTPVQEQSVPEIREGRDVYMCSETGTGKTLAYLLPLIEGLDVSSSGLQVVVLAPTHELGMQILRQVQDLKQNSGLDFRAVSLVGAGSSKRQREKLKKRPHLVVGSPGRVLELIKARKLKMHTVRTLVFDEADRLLHGEALALCLQIIRSCVRDRQLVFVSATAKAQCLGQARKQAPDLRELQAGSGSVSSCIEHAYLVCEERDKADLIRQLFHALEPERVIVFTHRNEMVERVAEKLSFHRLPCAAIHSECDKTEREQALRAFRSGKVRVLVASDVAARGLDVKGVTHVFNCDAPTQSNDYMHRVGRTGRAGEAGRAVSLLTDRETHLVKRYERELGVRFYAAVLKAGELLVSTPE